MLNVSIINERHFTRSSLENESDIPGGIFHIKMTGGVQVVPFRGQNGTAYGAKM